MIRIFKAIATLFGTVLQILLRMGLKRSEKNNMEDRMRTLEEDITDKENDIAKDKK